MTSAAEHAGAMGIAVPPGFVTAEGDDLESRSTTGLGLITVANRL